MKTDIFVRRLAIFVFTNLRPCLKKRFKIDTYLNDFFNTLFSAHNIDHLFNREGFAIGLH